MAVNFGILQPAQPVSAFFQGQQDVQQAEERNALRKLQMEQMGMERENLALQRQDRQAKLAAAAERQRFLSGLSAKMAEGGYKLDRPTLGQMLQFGMQTGEDSLVKLATEGMRALDEEDMYARETMRLGIAPGAAPAVAPSAAPANALTGAAPSAAPANALAGGYTREQVQQMVMSPSARLSAQGRALAPTLEKPAELTQLEKLMKARDALPAGDPRRATFDAAIQKATTHAPAPQTKVVLPEQEKEFEKALGAGQAKALLDSRAGAEDARSIIDTVNQGREIMKSGMITGAGADFLVSLNQGLKTVGIDLGYADAAANSQAFIANMGQNVGKLIKQFGAGTGLSDADRKYAEQIAGSKIALDAKALTKILDINERAARNVIKAHNKKAEGVKTNVSLKVEEPTTARQLSPMDQQALDWANANPSDPRAAQIKQRLGM